MLWILKIIVSIRQYFEHPKHMYVCLNRLIRNCRGGSRISGKGVHIYKLRFVCVCGGGGSLCLFYLIFPTYP